MGKTVKGALKIPREMLMNPEESQKLSQHLRKEGVAWEGRESSGDRGSQETCPLACVPVDHPQGEAF